MIRFLSAFGALAAATGLLTGAAGAPQPSRPAPTVVLGADDPVFLGRLVVTAAPLPAEAD